MFIEPIHIYLFDVANITFTTHKVLDFNGILQAQKERTFGAINKFVRKD